MFILDKYSIEILKYLNKNSKKQNPINLDTLYQSIVFDKTTINKVIKDLENNCMVVCNRETHLLPAGKVKTEIVSIYSTTIGKDYFKNKFLRDIQNFFLKCAELLFDRIILTIVVSIITSVLTTLITIHLFPK